MPQSMSFATSIPIAPGNIATLSNPILSTAVVDVEIRLSVRCRARPRRHCSVSHYAEGLKEVVIRSINHNDIGVCMLKGLSGSEPCKTAPIITILFIHCLICDSVTRRNVVNHLARIVHGHLRLDHGPDVSVFENQTLAFLCLSKHNIHHRPAQVVSPNDLVWKQQSKYGIDRA